jgi:hypothetical protein
MHAVAIMCAVSSLLHESTGRAETKVCASDRRYGGKVEGAYALRLDLDVPTGFGLV